MKKHNCPWCGYAYLITDRPISREVAQAAYQDHLNIGCPPATLGDILGKIITAQAKQVYDL